MYHSISEHATPNYVPFTVSPAVFAEHMAYLHRHEYTPITVSMFASMLTQGSYELPQRPIILTFDDGYAPSLTLADQTLYSQPISSGLLQAVDCVVIVTDHGYYDVPWIVREARYIVDTRNVTKGCINKKILSI